MTSTEPDTIGGEKDERDHGTGAYTIGANLENLTVTVTTGVNVTGNAVDNQIIGGAGNVGFGAATMAAGVGAAADFAAAAPPPSNALRPRPKAGFDMAGRVENGGGVVERVSSFLLGPRVDAPRAAQ